MTFTQIATRAVDTTRNLKPVDMSGKEAFMSSSMRKIAWLVLLMCLQFSHGSDPQPEQIHLSSTGNSSFKYIREEKIVN